MTEGGYAGLDSIAFGSERMFRGSAATLGLNDDQCDRVIRHWRDDWPRTLREAYLDYRRHMECAEAKGVPEGLARPCGVCGRWYCPCDWGM